MKDKKCEILHGESEVSLKDYFSSELDKLKSIGDERDKLYDTRFKASETAVSAALLAQKEAVANAFLASEKAIVKAEDAQKDYNQRSNEFRGQLDDQAKLFMTRSESLAMHKSTDDTLAALFKTMDDKIAVLGKSTDDKFITFQSISENRLEAQRVANEKVFDATAKDIQGLRESRSEVQGKGSGINTSWMTTIQIVGLISTIILLGLALSGHVH